MNKQATLDPIFYHGGTFLLWIISAVEMKVLILSTSSIS